MTCRTKPFSVGEKKIVQRWQPCLPPKREYRKRLGFFLGGLTEEQLNTTLVERPVDWGGELRTPAFILLHVITHAFHHKGQVVAMLRIIGYPAPDTDLQPV
jgi:uncharacterized damage-inducible protein DinB